MDVSVGSDDGVRNGALMHAFREVDKRNVNLGQFRIELVTPERSVGVLTMRVKDRVVGVDDQVTTSLITDSTGSLLDGNSLLDSLDGTIAPFNGGSK